MGTAADSHAWYQRFTAVEGDEESALYRALASERRRTVLTVLRQHDTPVSEPRLARLVSERETGDSPDAVATADHGRVRLSLHHVHLPNLEAAGLIRRIDDGHIDCARHPFWTTSDVRTLLTRDRVAPAQTTVTFGVLADHRRRAILTLLKDQQGLTVGEIAEELTDTPLSSQESPKLKAELVHCHLPKLEEAHVVEVDSGGSRIRYTGNVILEEWFSEVRT
ncbi:MAG: winged helix-turn-helix domain-containing protein [Salinigranum sp.]